MDSFLAVFDKLPPLRSQKNAQLAALLGFLFGGLGLGIYFLSFIDFILPTVITLLLASSFLAGQSFGFGFWVGVLFSSAYGYFRVISSNKRLTK